MTKSPAKSPDRHLRRIATACLTALLLAPAGGHAQPAAPTAESAPVQGPAPARESAPIRVALIEGMSGPFANAGAAVERNLRWAIERVNARGGVRLPDGAHRLELLRYDSQGSVETSLQMLRSATEAGSVAILQGNSSAVAAALNSALVRLNARDPSHRVLYLNYSAVSPELTGADCSPWHFRFDAHADMRMQVLVDAIAQDKKLESVWLLAQDYPFGHDVLRSIRRLLPQARPDVRIAGEALHPIGTVKDFAPYVRRLLDSGAQAVVTGNWGNDLTLFIRAAREAGFGGMFYTFYGNALGVPGVLRDAGVDRVVAVAEWFPNVPGEPSAEFVRAFRQRYPDPADDYLHLRMQQAIEMLARAIEVAGSTDAVRVGRALEGASWPESAAPAGAPPAQPVRPGDPGPIQSGTMRASDHQFIQPLYTAVMGRAGTPQIAFDTEGSGYGFRTLARYDADRVAMPSTCRMPPWPQPAPESPSPSRP